MDHEAQTSRWDNKLLLSCSYLSLSFNLFSRWGSEINDVGEASWGRLSDRRQKFDDRFEPTVPGTRGSTGTPRWSLLSRWRTDGDEQRVMFSQWVWCCFNTQSHRSVKNMEGRFVVYGRSPVSQWPCCTWNQVCARVPPGPTECHRVHCGADVLVKEKLIIQTFAKNKKEQKLQAEVQTMNWGL